MFFPRLLALDSRQNRIPGEHPCFMEFLEDLAFPLANRYQGITYAIFSTFEEGWVWLVEQKG